MSPGGPPMVFRGFMCRLELGEPAMSARGPSVSPEGLLYQPEGIWYQSEGLLCRPEGMQYQKEGLLRSPVSIEVPPVVGQRSSYINHFRRPMSVRGPPFGINKRASCAGQRASCAQRASGTDQSAFCVG